MSQPKYSERTFHRKFEASFGNLTADQFPPIDWSKKDELELLFPLYKREQLKDPKSQGGLLETVTIQNFELWTPTRTQQLLKDTKLTIEPNKRAAVYGINGSGKTLLFNQLATGEVADFPKSISVHHMEEMSMDPVADAVSVMDTIINSHPWRRVLACMEPHLESLIVEEKDEERLKGLKENLKYVQASMKSIQGYDAEERVSKNLRVLGFDEKGEKSLMSSLSGGLRMRVALVAAFFINPALLLLDEPTNHLDLPSVLWLENKLRGYQGSFLLVTHDRHILENVVTSVMQLQDQKIGNYNTGFAQYEKTREIEDAQREKMIAQFMAKNQNIDHFSPDYKTKDNYSKWLAARQKRKIAMEGKFKFKHPAPLKAPPGVEQKDISLIKLEDVTFCYNVEAGLPYIFKTPISYDVKVGTRVGIMGPNGAGKSTILKLITAFLHPTTGTVTRNPDFTLAYFGQHSTKELQMEDTPIEFMVKSFPKANKGDLISHLEKTGVLRNAQDARMKNISFSQRSCVVFAKLTFVPPHLLIMDEPTNFLDLESVDSLIKAANAFKGGLITVTHNRDFLKRCSKHFLSIVPGAFLEFDTMKDAERATYSFIGALERGEDVDHKTAIQENRGGGAEHSAEYLAKKEAERKKILKEQDERRKAEAAALAEAARLLAIKEEKEAKKKASQRTDWKKDEVCWAPIPGQRGAVWTKVVVVRNIPAMGVTVALPGGGNKLFEAKKLKMENPEGGKNAAPVQQAKGGRGGGRGAGNQKGGRGAKGGRGGRGNNRAQSAPKGGGRGGARGAAGGRGGRGQRQRGQRKNSASAA